MALEVEVLRELDSKMKRGLTELTNISSLQQALTNPEISVAIKWILERCQELIPDGPAVGQKSAITFLKVLAKSKLKKNTAIELIAWISISLELKILGDFIPIEQLVATMQNRFDANSIIVTEIYIVKLISWEINPPTLYEMETLLLSPFKEKSHDILKECSEFNHETYSDFLRLQHGLLVLSMLSILRSLTSLGLDELYKKFVSLYTKDFNHELGHALKLLQVW